MQSFYPESMGVMPDGLPAQASDRAREMAKPITQGEVAKTKREIKRLRKSLEKWVKARLKNDGIAAGTVPAKVSPKVFAKTLPLARDWQAEQRIALRVYTLLSEVMDASQLPDPDISKDPNAAVKLAQILIRGALPEEAQSPKAQGLVWMPIFVWPMVALAGIVAFTIMIKVRSDAEVAMHREEEITKRAGATTDSGFWLMLASVSVLGLMGYRLLQSQGFIKKKGS